MHLIFKRAVGQHAQQIPVAVLALHRHLLGLQGVEHGLSIRHQLRITHQIGGEVRHRPANVYRHEVNDLRGLGREAQDVQLRVNKYRGNVGAGQQVVHVIVGTRQLGHLGLQLGVDRGQLFVDGLHFFARGFQLFIAGLKLFVDGLHLFVGRLQLLIGGF